MQSQPLTKQSKRLQNRWATKSASTGRDVHGGGVGLAHIDLPVYLRGGVGTVLHSIESGISHRVYKMRVTTCDCAREERRGGEEERRRGGEEERRRGGEEERRRGGEEERRRGGEEERRRGGEEERRRGGEEERRRGGEEERRRGGGEGQLQSLREFEAALRF